MLQFVADWTPSGCKLGAVDNLAHGQASQDLVLLGKVEVHLEFFAVSAILAPGVTAPKDANVLEGRGHQVQVLDGHGHSTKLFPLGHQLVRQGLSLHHD